MVLCSQSRSFCAGANFGDAKREVALIAREELIRFTSNQVREEAIKLATEIVVSAPLAVVSTRATLRAGLVDAIRNAVARESIEQNWHFKTDGFKEGVAAMAERRESSYCGVSSHETRRRHTETRPLRHER